MGSALGGGEEKLSQCAGCSAGGEKMRRGMLIPGQFWSQALPHDAVEVTKWQFTCSLVRSNDLLCAPGRNFLLLEGV